MALKIKYKSFTSFFTVLMIIVLSALLIYCDPMSASNLIYTPDSTEYAIGAHRFATSGEYKIPLENHWLPPHYPPWFSILILSPVYLILGSEIGNAIYPITIFGIGGVIIAFFLGKKIGGNWGGIFASLSVLALPLYRYWSKHVMTDVPATVLMLGACLLYLRLRAMTDARPLAYLLPGIITAVAALFRPVCTAAILPFLLSVVTYHGLTLALRKLAFLVAPLVFAATVSLAYNTSVFGSPFRTGYHFWEPVPFDFVHFTFSLSNVYTNLIALLLSHAVLLVCAACAVLALECRINNMNTKQLPCSPDIRWIVEFMLLGTGPIVLFHLLYFYLDPRFYLAPLVLVVILTGGIIGSWLNKKSYLALVGVIALALLFIIINLFPNLGYLGKPEQVSHKRFTVEEILKYTPENAWIISGIEPVYLEYLVAKESRRRIVPISRHIEYVNKAIAPKKISSLYPPPKSWNDVQRNALLRAGAKEAVFFVASEQLDSIAAQLAKGTKVYIATTNIKIEDQEVLDELKRRFLFIPRSATLFELKLHGRY